MVDTCNLLAHGGRRVVATNELSAARRLRKYAGRKQRGRIVVEHAIGNRVVGERLSGYDSGGGYAAGAVGAKINDSGRNRNDARLAIGKRGRDHSARTRAASVGILTGQRNRLVRQSDLN